MSEELNKLSFEEMFPHTYKIVDDFTILVDEKSSGKYVEVESFSDSNFAALEIVSLSQNDSASRYSLRHREYVKMRNESRFKIVTDNIMGIYENGERVD